jgi:hypothetical protein
MKTQLAIGLLTWCLTVQMATAQPATCDQEQSRSEVARLTDAKTIVSIDQFPPYVTVVVTERVWKKMDADAKQALAFHVDCSIAGPDNSTPREVSIRSDADNRQLGVYAQSHLTLE